ncbi:MAG: hypothetical protein HZC17_02495 [Candidatus Omnitrophica bacterium]|nr:hypothetical protein [Candidatus Omnitrophota bacterium]
MKQLQQESILKFLVGILITAFALFPCPYLSAQTNHVNQQIIIEIPRVMMIESDMDNIVLKFSDNKKGSQSDSKTVYYTVQANDLSKNEGVLQGTLQSEIPGVVVTADVNGFSKEGGNAHLVPAGSGAVPLSTTPARLADNQPDEGSGKVVRGKLSITFKATAEKDLEYQTITPRVTISILDA